MNFYTPGFTVRESAMPLYSDGQVKSPQLNHRGELVVAQGLPSRAEIVSRGHSWWAKSAATTPVVAFPTDACLVSLWNGSPDRVYLIDSVFVVQIVVTAAVQNVGIIANLSKIPVTTAPAATVTKANINPMYGNLGYAGMGIVGAPTLDGTSGVAANWQPLGSTGPAQNTLQIGTVVDHDCLGRFVVPPGGLFALSALAGAATANSIQLGVRWHEVKLKTV